MTRAEKQFYDMLELAGLELVATRRNKHVVVRVRLKGHLTQRSMTVGYTPSDHRAHKNNAALVRRIVRELETQP